MNRPGFPANDGMRPHRPGQRGATLIIGLIMIVLITLIVVNAFTLSSSNLKSVGNMQVREESIAAANLALEQVLSSNFITSTATQVISIDINKDATDEYTVSIAPPTCMKVVQASPGFPSDVELGAGMSSGATYFTDWELEASVSDEATGASVRIKEGIRALISQAEKDISCP